MKYASFFFRKLDCPLVTGTIAIAWTSHPSPPFFTAFIDILKFSHPIEN
jgi:hypothetical protein